MKETKKESEKNKEETETIASETSELTELKDLLQRTQANFENYRKQSEKRIEEIRGSAARNMIVELLPIVDHFALALKSINLEKETESRETNKEFIEGIELIYSQLNNLLVNHQVQKINSLNEKFNPHFHEALLKVPSAETEGTILEVFQDGYLLDGKVIRHARVKISAGNYKDNITVNTENTEKKENKDDN